MSSGVFRTWVLGGIFALVTYTGSASAQLTLSASHTDASCNGANNGTATAQIKQLLRPLDSLKHCQARSRRSIPLEATTVAQQLSRQGGLLATLTHGPPPVAQRQPRQDWLPVNIR